MKSKIRFVSRLFLMPSLHATARSLRVLPGLALAAAALALVQPAAHAATITAVADGDWNTTNTWDTLRVPTSNDAVVVNGHAITIDPAVSPTPAAAKSITVIKALNVGSVEVFSGQSLTTDAISVESQECKLKGAGDVVIGPLKVLQISLWSWADITARIVDNPGGFSAVTIETHHNEVNWSGSHAYRGGTTINGNEQLNAATVDCFGTGPVTLNDGTRLAYLSGQTNSLTINNGSLTADSWNGPITLPDACNAQANDGVTLNGKVRGPGGITIWDGATFTSSENDFTGGTTIARGTLVCSHTNALGTGALSISSGGKADLNYSGNHVVSSLTINGVVQNPGTYGSASSPANNKNSSYFAGVGTVEVHGPPDQAAIFTFGLPGLPAVITGTNIAWTVPYEYGNSSLAPDYTMPTDASGSPAPLETNDFSGLDPVKFTIISKDLSTTNDYFVTVTVLPKLALPVTDGVRLWLDASQLTGLSDGATVANWTDMSGLGNNATNSSGSPKYKTGVLNGRPVIRFIRGNVDRFTTADLSGRFSVAATVFIVATINPDTPAYTLVYTSADAGEWWRWDGDNNFYPAVFRSPRVEHYCVMPSSGTHLFAISSSSSAWQMWINGTNQGAEGGSYSAGGVHVIGSGSNGGTLDGDIAEIVEFNRALNPGELTKMGTYLEHKYGLDTEYPDAPIPLSGVMLIIR